MGQHSSKRRSYTPGEDVSDEIPSVTLANGNVTKYDVKTASAASAASASSSANGGLQTHRSSSHKGGKDVQIRAPTSLTPVDTEQQQQQTGAKEKRKSKKLRFGFPLRRTSSGRWTRKRRSMRANGSTRPVSCPVPDARGADKGTQPRPQSLFEEEVVHEEDGRMDTIDLSDHEEHGHAKAEQTTSNPVPKPREKKIKRTGSDKKQGSKKKKKEKKNSKKDKSKKPLASTKTTKAPDVPVLLDQEKETSITTGEIKKEEDMATVEVCPPVDQEETKSSESVDIDKLASSIVNESVTIARDRFMAEQGATGSDDSTAKESKDSEQVANVSIVVESPTPEPVEEILEAPTCVSNVESTPSPPEDSPREIEEDVIIPSKVPVKKTSPALFMAEENEEKGSEKIEEEKAEENESIEPTVVVQTETLPYFGKLSRITDPLEPIRQSVEVSYPLQQDKHSDEATSEDLQEVIEELIVEERVDKNKTIPVPESFPEFDPSVDSSQPNLTDELTNDENDVDTKEKTASDNENVDMVDSAAKGVVAVISEEIQRVDSTQVKNSGKGGGKEVDEEAEKAMKAKLAKEHKEKEKQEKEKVKKQKEEQKAKERERLKEEKKKKAEQKALKKVKMREKGEKKTSITKRLSDWFKKDKPKSSSEASEPTPAADASGGEAGARVGVTDTETNAELSASPVDLETAVTALPSTNEASSSNTPASAANNESLSIDVSVQPLPPDHATTNELDESISPAPSPSDSSSPDSGPASPVSYDIPDEPITPPSDGERSGVLKKISLGPRLRTAILRKKSSSASESGADDKRVSLTQPKVVETDGVTPPPRKLRPRKPVEQYSPITTGAHNPVKYTPPQNTSPRLDLERKDSSPVNVGSDPSFNESLSKEAESLANDLSANCDVDQAKDNKEDVDRLQPVNDSVESLINAPVVTESASATENIIEKADTLVCNTDSSSEPPAITESVPTVENVIETENPAQVIDTTDSAPFRENDGLVVEEISVTESIVVESTPVTESAPAVDSTQIKTELPSELENMPVSNGAASPVEEEITVSVSASAVESAVEISKDLKTGNDLTTEEITSSSADIPESSENSKSEIISQTEDEQNISEAGPERRDSLLNFASSLKSDDNESLLNEIISEINHEDVKSKISSSSQVEAGSEEQDKKEEDEKNSDPSDDLESPLVLPTIVSKASIVLRPSSSGSHDSISRISSYSLEEVKGLEVEHTEMGEVFSDVEKKESEEEKKTEFNSSDISSTLLKLDSPDDRQHTASTLYKVVCTAQAEDGQACRDKQLEAEGEFITTAAPNHHEDTNASASSSPLSNHWESPKLDIQLDDSAIELDKESPLAEASSPAQSNGSGKHEDEGVNSDHSGDGSDNNQEYINKNMESNGSDPTSTIEAYLKLQQVDIKDKDIKNHMEADVKTPECKNGVEIDAN